MKKIIIIISIITLFLPFVKYTCVYAKTNFDYNVFTPNSYANSNNINQKYADSATVLFIVDFSNSMNEKLGGRTKLQIAQDTLSTILPRIPHNVETALRVYGHKVGFTYMQGCMASKLAVPFSTNNSRAILSSLYATDAIGWTPITYSLKQAVNVDFAGKEGKKHIVLLTDGGENCDESPCDYAIELMKIRNDVSIDVIAFDIYDKDANDQLRCAALATSGKFYTANSQSQLLDSLFESLNIDKDVHGTIKIDEN